MRPHLIPERDLIYKESDMNDVAVDQDIATTFETDTSAKPRVRVPAVVGNQVPVVSERVAIMTPAEMLSSAVQQGRDIQYVEKLMDLQDRWESSEQDKEKERARREYSVAMAGAQAEMPVIQKNQKNQHTQSRYADISAVYAKVVPIYTAHGFSVEFWPGEDAPPGYVRVMYEINHSGGYSKVRHYDAPCDTAGAQGKVNKTGVQGDGSTFTYARRYLTLLTFNVATSEDADGNSPVKVQNEPEKISIEQSAAIISAAKKVGIDEATVCYKCRIAHLRDLESARYTAVMNDLARLLKAQEAK